MIFILIGLIVLNVMLIIYAFKYKKKYEYQKYLYETVSTWNEYLVKQVKELEDTQVNK